MEQNPLKELLKTQIINRMHQGCTMKDAVSQLLVFADADMRRSLGEIMEEHDAATRDWVQRFVIQGDDESTVVPKHQRTWYLEPQGGGLRWTRLRERMESGNMASAVESVDTSTKAIVSQLAEPFSDERRLGLVIGNVQSGKTANYAALCAKALDVGYQAIFILSGIHNNLRAQTQKRLNRDLGVDVYGDEWFQLTTVQHDIQPADVKNARANISSLNDKTKLIAVLKKNTKRLDHLLAFLELVEVQALKRTPILIIDDEADQATPDSSSKPEDDPTRINEKMRKIWGHVQNGTYVGYTATPFANVFMNPEDGSDGSLESLYPRDFIHVMPTSSEYFGAERLFGIRAGSIDADDAEGLDIVRSIPSDEVPLLSPSGRDDAESFVPVVTKSLGDAVRWFIVATAIRRLRGQKDQHSSMLIHTTHRVSPHFAMRDQLLAFLEPIKERARTDEDVSEFKEIFMREEDRVAELYKGDGPAPTWPALKEEIVNVLRVLKITVDNGEEPVEDRLSYSDDSPSTVIVIGGGTLSRGLTLEGLFVSYFTRTSNAYDTLLQMGRWFGYRPGYEDLQRIWLADGLETDYQFLAQVEAEMRAEIARIASEGKTPGEVGVRIRQHPGRLQITAAGKMKHADQVEFTFQGYRTQTTMFDFSEPSVQEKNLRAALDLLGEVSSSEAPTSGTGARVYMDVDYSVIRKFFDEFQMHEKHETTHRRAIEWVGRKLPNVPWRVVLASGSRDQVFAEQGFTVSSVNRAPRRHPEEKSVNIRALMSGADRIADLVATGIQGAQDSGSEEDHLRLRRTPVEEGGAGGQGLLILYPISRDSESKRKSPDSQRADMRDVLKAIDPSLAESGDDPIIGYGMVLPFDMEGAIGLDGDFAAVSIDAESMDAEEDE